MKSRLFITVLLALLTLGLSTGASAVSWTMTRASFSAGTNPASVAVADFNGDGIPDVAVADKATPGQIVVHLGKPNGRFAASRVISIGSKPISIVAADFNEDGKMDLAVADWADNTVHILLGKGDGRFELHAVPAIGGLGLNPVHLRAADLGNGHQDLVVACFNSDKIYVLIGNGDGTFQTPVPYTVGTNPRHVCIADFNHDGHPDIAVTLWGDDKVAVLLGNGDGTFQPPVKYATGNNPLAVEAADLNGDGNVDLAISEFKNDGIKILDGNGFGNFSTPPVGQADRLPAPSGPGEMVLKDLDGDGNTDIAVVGSASNTISVFLGRGDGTFQTRRVFPTGSSPVSLASADVDRNGLPDLVSSAFVSYNISLDRAVTTSVGFWSYTTIPSASYTVGTAPSALLADDFDYDGVMDIAVANKGSNNVSVLLNRKFRFGNMSGLFGNFTSAIDTPAPGAPPSFASLSTISAPSGIASGVFTNSTGLLHPADFRAGIAVANSGNNTVAVLLPNGGGTFKLPGSAASPQILLAGKNPSAIKTASFYRVNRTDIAVCNQDDGTITVFLGNGDGTFGDGKGTVVSKSGTPYTVGNGPVAMAVGDFNKDGILDIAVANSGLDSLGHTIGNGSISILFGKGNGKFGAARNMLSGIVNPTSIAATGGGLVITEPNGKATILNNNGSGIFSLGKGFTVGTSPAGILAQDVTNNRVRDIVTANTGSNDITLVQGLAAGGFSKYPVSFPAGAGPVALAAHDFNGDGATDLAVADSGGGVTILFGRDIATLTVNINDSTRGSVTVQGTATGTQTATADSTVFQEEGGKQLKLTATANNGYKFVRWTGGLAGSKNPDYLDMNVRAKTVTAVFEATP